jgi:hypothetical protein
MVSEKASRKEPLTSDRSLMDHGKKMAFLKARWKLNVSLKAPTKAELAEAESLPVASEKVRTMV